MKRYDLVIANPPYGRIGTDVTQAIIDGVDFGEYVNLLPVTNYRLSKRGLQKHVDPAELITTSGGFDDTREQPTLGHVYKEEINGLTPIEFRIKNQKDALSEKYFFENASREATWKKIRDAGGPGGRIDDFSKIAFLPMRFAVGGIGSDRPYMQAIGLSAESASYKVAFDLIRNSSEMVGGTPNCGTYICFETVEEKRNLAEFLFGSGFKFTQWLFSVMKLSVAHSAEHSLWLPRVDWRRAWTPAEILREYGYSEAEITEVESRASAFKELKR